MDWWRWLATGALILVLVILLLLWFDSLRDRPGWTVRRAGRTAALGAISIPVGVALTLVLPLWAVLVLIAIPALLLAVLALAS